MAKTPESIVKSKVEKILQAYKAYYFFPATHGYGRSGVPDIIVCYRGRFVGIECKAGKGKTTALQDRELEKITTAGGVSLVINENNLIEVSRCLSLLESYYGKS